MTTPFRKREVGVHNTDFTRFLDLYPQLHPQFALAGDGQAWTAMDAKPLIYQRKRASTGLVWTPLGWRQLNESFKPA